MAVDREKDLVMVTTASGRQASHLLSHLYGQWRRLRLVVHSASSEERLKKQYPNAEVTRADLANADEAARVLDGVTSLFHNCPPMNPRESQMTYNMIDAAVAETKRPGNTFQHFIFSSVLNSQLHKMLHHDEKKFMEAYLMESGLQFTILQPTHFMDSFPIPVIMAQDKPVYPARWDPDVLFSYIAVRDIGEAAAKILQERERHYFAQYPLAGPDPPMGYTQVCKIVGAQLGKEIEIKKLPYEEAVDSFVELMFGGGKADGGKSEGVHPHTRDCAERMLLYYNRRGLVGNSNVLEWLLGRMPTSYREWVQIRVKEVKAQAS